MVKTLFRVLSHNDNHHLTVCYDRQEYHLCTRCTGMLVGFLLALPLWVVLGAYGFSGPAAAGFSLLLFLPDFLYWALTRVKLVPDVPQIRVGTGVFLGGAIALFGQTRISWEIKLGIPLLLLGMVFLANPILGRLNLREK